MVEGELQLRVAFFGAVGQQCGEITGNQTDAVDGLIGR